MVFGEPGSQRSAGSEEGMAALQGLNMKQKANHFWASAAYQRPRFRFSPALPGSFLSIRGYL